MDGAVTRQKVFALNFVVYKLAPDDYEYLLIWSTYFQIVQATFY